MQRPDRKQAGKRRVKRFRLLSELLVDVSQTKARCRHNDGGVVSKHRAEEGQEGSLKDRLGVMLTIKPMKRTSLGLESEVFQETYGSECESCPLLVQEALH